MIISTHTLEFTKHAGDVLHILNNKLNIPVWQRFSACHSVISIISNIIFCEIFASLRKIKNDDFKIKCNTFSAQ
jgi:hypothetical protein